MEHACPKLESMVRFPGSVDCHSTEDSLVNGMPGSIRPNCSVELESLFDVVCPNVFVKFLSTQFSLSSRITKQSLINT
jgi:hypothetical protein